MSDLSASMQCNRDKEVCPRKSVDQRGSDSRSHLTKERTSFMDAISHPSKIQPHQLRLPTCWRGKHATFRRQQSATFSERLGTEPKYTILWVGVGGALASRLVPHPNLVPVISAMGRWEEQSCVYNFACQEQSRQISLPYEIPGSHTSAVTVETSRR